MHRVGQSSDPILRGFEIVLPDVAQHWWLELWGCGQVCVHNRLLSSYDEIPNQRSYSGMYSARPENGNTQSLILLRLPMSLADRSRVKKTGRNRSGNRGYRSNRPGPVPVPAGSNRAQIQILNLNSKKWKNPQKILKILQVVTNLMMSNFFKYSFI